MRSNPGGWLQPFLEFSSPGFCATLSISSGQCENVNFKLDSPLSESDRGESQLNVGRAACWSHLFLPSHWIDEKRELCILYNSPGALSLSVLS